MMILPGGVQSTCKHPFKLPSMIAFHSVSLVHVSALALSVTYPGIEEASLKIFKNEASLPCKPVSGVLRGSSLFACEAEGCAPAAPRTLPCQLLCWQSC